MDIENESALIIEGANRAQIGGKIQLCYLLPRVLLGVIALAAIHCCEALLGLL